MQKKNRNLALLITGIFSGICSTAQAAYTVNSNYLPEVQFSSGGITADYSAFGFPTTTPVQGIPIWMWRNNTKIGEAQNAPTDLSRNCDPAVYTCTNTSQLGNTSPNYTSTYPFVISAGNQTPGPHFSGTNSANVLYYGDPRLNSTTAASWINGNPADYDHIQLYNVTSTSPANAEANGDYFTYSITTGSYSPDYELIFSGTSYKQGGQSNKEFMKYSRQVIISDKPDFSNAKVITQDSDTVNTPTTGEYGQLFLNGATPLVAKPNTTYYIKIYFYNVIQPATITNVPPSIYLDDFAPLMTVKTTPDVITYTEGQPAQNIDLTAYPATSLDNPLQSSLIVPASITLTPDATSAAVTNDVTTLKVQAKNIQDGNAENLIIGGVTFQLATSKSVVANGLSYNYDAASQLLTITGGNSGSYQTLMRGAQYQDTSLTPTATTSSDATTVHPGAGQFSNTQRILNFTTVDSAGQESNIAPAYINVIPIDLPITKAVSNSYIKVNDGTPHALPLSTAALDSSTLTPPTLTYTLTVTNPGVTATDPYTAAVNNIYVTDLLPAGLRYVAGTTTVNGSPATNPTESTDATTNRDYLKFSIGNLAVGATATINFQATTLQTTGTLTTLKANTNASSYVNVANVYANVNTLADIDATITDADGVKHPKIYPVDKSNTVTTGVVYTKLLKLANNISHPTTPVWLEGNKAYPGDTLQYCIDFYNFGTTSLSGYAVSDALPLNTKYVGNSMTINEGTMNTQGTAMTPATQIQPNDGDTSGLIGFSGLTLGAGQSGTLCFKVTVQ